MERPWWHECRDQDVLAAAVKVWQRLPAEAQRRIAPLKLYSVRDLKTFDGKPALGLARPGAVYINPDRARLVLEETIAHEWAHHTLGHIGELARCTTVPQIKAIQPRHEAEVIQQLRAWGFEKELAESRMLRI